MRGGWHGTLGLLACIILSISLVHANEVKKDVNKESAVIRSGTNATLKDASPRLDSKDEKIEIVTGKEPHKKLEPKDGDVKNRNIEERKQKIETLSADQIKTLKTASLQSSRRNKNIVQINGNLHTQNYVSLRTNSPNRRSMSSDTEDIDVIPDSTSRFGYSVPFNNNGRPAKIQDNDILLPHLIPSLANVIICAREGDMYYLTTNRCYICACVRYGPSIIPKCAQCMDTCGTSNIINPIIPSPTQPIIPINPDVPIAPESCYPFKNLVPFENPLNPCQTCVCSPVVTSLGQPDIMVTCENNLECVLPPNPPYHIPDDNIIITPTPSPFDNIVPRPNPSPPLPWPPSSMPPGPLPGPSPHDTCSPYPPNTYFAHPWDECQLCICMESRNVKGTEIEVSCRTKPECCIVPPPTTRPDIEPNPQPEYLSSICKSRPLDQIFSLQQFPCNNFVCHLKFNQIYTEVLTNNQCQKDLLIIPDKICEFKSIGVEFMHPQEKCKVCRCEIYGSIVAPVCKKGSMQECNEHIYAPSVPEINIIFIEPQCKYTPPHQDFAMGCTKCQCAPVFSYVVANCLPQPVCEKFPTPVIYDGHGQELQLQGQAQAFAQAQAQSLAQSLATSLAKSQSQGQAFVQGQSQAMAQSMAQGQSQTLAQSLAQTQGNSASAQAQATASSGQAFTNGIGDYGTAGPGVAIQYPYLPDYQSTILYGQGGQTYQGGQAFQGGQSLGSQTFQGSQPLGGQTFQGQPLGGQTFQGQPLGGQAFQGQAFQGNQPFQGGQAYGTSQPLPTSSFLPQWNQYQYPSNMYYYQPLQGHGGENQYAQGYTTVDWQPVAQNQYSYPVPYQRETINTQTLAIAEANTDDSSLGVIPIGTGQISSGNLANALSEVNSVGPTSAYSLATGTASTRLNPSPSSKLRLRLRTASRPENE